tara:strand:- start:266 stop:577 length:312 start_codon:yes stop_codon:yes gene_type:complete
MVVELVEIYQDKVAAFNSKDGATQEYSLREVFINPEHVVMLRPNNSFVNKEKTISLPEGLHLEQQYTTIYMNRGHSGIEIIVVGSPNLIEEKFRTASKRLLKG